MSVTYFFDIGNSRAKFWRCDGDDVVERIAIAHGGNIDFVMDSLPASFARDPDRLCGLVVLSEDERIQFLNRSEHKWGRRPLFAASENGFGRIQNGYTSPGTLGIDRWIGIIGAAADRENVSVVSCGTAVTLDVVLGGSDHVGGYILPGLRLMSEALQANTAGVRFESAEGRSLQLGRSTAEAVMNGALAATVSAIERVAAECDISKTVLTGGDAVTISPHLRIRHVVEPDLLLFGLKKYFRE